MINNNDKINESNLNNYESKTHFLSTHSTAFELIEFNSKILSIGCGNAHVEKKLISEKKCIVDGVDFIESKESKSLNKFLVVDLDKESIPLELKDYDYILLLDVIEHLKNPEKFLNQLNKKIS